MSASLPVDAGRQLLERWATRPNRFAREALGIRTYSAPPPELRHGSHGQADILRALARGERFIAVRSGQKTGKSISAAIATLWWALVKRRGRVILTAPTAQQVERILWKEVRYWYERARIPIGGACHDTPYAGLRLPFDREAFGRTARDVEGLQGISGAEQLVIVDEASGYPEHLFEGIFGNLSGGGAVLLLGNPTRPSGTFYDAFHSRRSAWCTLHLSSLDTPNHKGHAPPIPGLSDPAILDFYREVWGEGTPAWQVRILGEFPTVSTDTIISLALLEEAKSREQGDGEGALFVGVDPARFGDDDSVVVLRRGNALLCMLVVKNADGPDLAGAVLQSLGHFRLGVERVTINVDVVGIGASCFDTLARLDTHNLRVNPIVGNARATTAPLAGPGYRDLNAQLWHGARDWLQGGGGIFAGNAPTEWAKRGIRHAASGHELAKFEGELVGRVYSFDEQGRVRLEPKDLFKKRIGRSPDRADAFVYAVYEPPVVEARSGGRARTMARAGGY